jgi:hypothetical protein
MGKKGMTILFYLLSCFDYSFASRTPFRWKNILKGTSKNSITHAILLDNRHSVIYISGNLIFQSPLSEGYYYGTDRAF